MEFTFGLLFGAFLGIAAWLSRKEINLVSIEPAKKDSQFNFNILKDIAITLMVGIMIFWLFSTLLDPVVDAGNKIHGFTMLGSRDMAILFSNYAFFGLLMIITVMVYPRVAWQIAITLTFCHTVIDLMGDVYPDPSSTSAIMISIFIILLTSFIVAILTAWYQHRKNPLHHLFLLLVWSTVFVAFMRLTLNPGTLNLTGLSLAEIILGRFFVHLIFLTSAIFVSWTSYQKQKNQAKYLQE